MTESDKHSQSTYIQPLENPTAFSKATFVPFAPQPCVCCGCLANEAEQLRTYAVVYDSKLEINSPCAPCCCCSTEQCIVDRVKTMFMDKPPFRSGMCCVCIPCTCCGPPVVFSKTPKCCTMDLTWAYGQQVWAAPANIYGLKTMICCCAPCYSYCAYPIVTGLNDSKTFMQNMKAAADAYATPLRTTTLLPLPRFLPPRATPPAVAPPLRVRRAIGVAGTTSSIPRSPRPSAPSSRPSRTTSSTATRR